MNTIQRSFSVLRGIALAGLGAAMVWAAAPAQATTEASDAAGLAVTRAARGQAVLRSPSLPGRQSSEPEALPAPILVAPCAHCLESPLQGLALPAPVLVAPCPQCMESPSQGSAPQAPILVAPCGHCLEGPLQGLGLPAPILVAPCPQCQKSPLQGLALPAPILVAPGCGAGCRPAQTPADVRIAPASLLLAGGEPPVVVDSWWRWLFG